MAGLPIAHGPSRQQAMDVDGHEGASGMSIYGNALDEMSEKDKEIAALKALNERLMLELTNALDIAEDFMRKDLDSSLVARQENGRLRVALEKYKHCRHGCQACFCTMEARAALCPK